MKKLKQILAIIGIILIAGMYLVSLVCAIIGSEASKSLFVASLYCTFVIPALIWIIERVYGWADGKNEDKRK